MAYSIEVPQQISSFSHDAVPLERLSDHQEIESFLMADKLANVYLLGKLDPAYVPFCSWHGERDEKGRLVALMLSYTGLSIPVAFFVASESRNPAGFFASCAQLLPTRFHFHVIGEDLDLLRRSCHVSSYQKMCRMGLDRERFDRPSSPHLPGQDRAVSLGHKDTASIMALYAHYPDHFFEPTQLETGLYFGVRDLANPKRLLSIGGVHAVSPSYDVAIVGNLVTHPDARGQHLATVCTAALLGELFKQVSFVALNVQAVNEPAIRLYTNFGFDTNNVFFEGRCE